MSFLFFSPTSASTAIVEAPFANELSFAGSDRKTFAIIYERWSFDGRSVQRAKEVLPTSCKKVLKVRILTFCMWALIVRVC